MASRQLRKALVLASALLAVFLWTSLPLPASHPPIPSACYLAPYSYYWRPLHEAATQRQDWREAARILEQFLRAAPEEFGAADESASDPPSRSGSRDTGQRIAEGRRTGCRGPSSLTLQQQHRPYGAPFSLGPGLAD
jgi:hypothetical protein